MLTIKLPFPDAKLSPNARLHWAQRHKASKAAKGNACVATIRAMQDKYPGSLERDFDTLMRKVDVINIELQFVPKAAHRYDQDNLIARMKAALDGISAAIGVDDVKFNIQQAEIMPPCKDDPHVLVSIG